MNIRQLFNVLEFDDYAKLTGIAIREGSKLTGGNQAIIDTVWQKEHHATIGSAVIIFEHPFTIVGVYEPPGGGRETKMRRRYQNPP